MLPSSKHQVIIFGAPDPLRTPSLSIVARTGNADAVRALLKSGRRPDSVDNRGWTPLHEAAAGGHTACVVLLLKTGKCNVNIRTYEGETPLYLAINPRTNLEVLKILLNHRAEVSLGNNEEVTPLHKACMLGLLPCVRLLVESGASIDAADADKNRPIHEAIYKRSVEVVKLLVRNEADLTVKNGSGLYPLMSAALIGFHEVIKELDRPDLKVVNRCENEGRTALMMAAQFGCLETVKSLIEIGANPNVISRDMNSALHIAAHGDDPRIVECLVKVTSLEVIGDCTNGSPVILAIDSMQIESLKFLLVWAKKSNIRRAKCCIQETNSHLYQLYRYMGTISYLLYYKAEQEQLIDMLRLLLNHGFPIRVHPVEVPPLVAITASSGSEKTKRSVIKLLVEAGASPEHHCARYESSRNSTVICTSDGIRNPKEVGMQIPSAILFACKIYPKDKWLVRLLLSYSRKFDPDTILHMVLTELESLEVSANQPWPTGMLLETALELGVSDLHTLFQINKLCWQPDDGAPTPELLSRKDYHDFKKMPYSPSSLSQLCRLVVRRNYPLQRLKCMQLPNIILNFINYVF